MKKKEWEKGYKAGYAKGKDNEKSFVQQKLKCTNEENPSVAVMKNSLLSYLYDDVNLENLVDFLPEAKKLKAKPKPKQAPAKAVQIKLSKI